MEEHHYAWLEDNTGARKPAAQLPTQLQSMTDDPMRTLSAWVRKNCGYIKCGEEKCVDGYRQVSCASENTYFLEFKWADYLRNMDDPKITVVDHAECSQEDLNGGLCLKGQNSKLIDALPGAASHKAKEVLGDAAGYNPNVYDGTPACEG
jgi:hypothetical protein